MPIIATNVSTTTTVLIGLFSGAGGVAVGSVVTEWLQSRESRRQSRRESYARFLQAASRVMLFATVKQTGDRRTKLRETLAAAMVAEFATERMLQTRKGEESVAALGEAWAVVTLLGKPDVIRLATRLSKWVTEFYNEPSRNYDEAFVKQQADEYKVRRNDFLRAARKEVGVRPTDPEMEVSEGSQGNRGG